MRKVFLLIALVLVVIGIGIAVTQAWSALAAPPEQPIPFPHTVHVQLAQLDCQFCHRTAAVAQPAGLPSVQQCMFCHQVVATNRPTIQTLINHWETQTPINWERVHRVPDHVRFAHEPHITAGVQCSTCHGEVGQMAVVRQVRPLNMGDCVNCHRVNNAPTDCTFCHY